MLRLRTILHSNYFYLILLFLLFLYCFIYFHKPRSTSIDINDNSFIGIITNYKIDKSLLTLELKGKEKIIGYYYFKSEKEINSFSYKLGDKVFLKGEFSLPSKNTIFNLFNYRKYLKHKKIYVIMNIDSIEKISSTNNLFYKTKNFIYNHIDKYKSKSYLKTFILGDKNDIDSNIKTTYQENGISHLLAISGMHISILSMFLLFLFKNNKYKLIIVCSFLFFYMFLTGLSPSVCRCSLLFFLIALNKKLKLEIETIKLLVLVFILLVFINPYIIYDIGFIYSFTISFYLILFKDRLKNVFSVSVLSFFISLPITLYSFYEVNILSIIFNLVFVPFVSIVIFPFSIITFFIPVFDNFFLLITNMLERLAIFSNSFNTMLILGKVNIYFIISYYLFITLFLFFKKKKYLFLLILVLFIQYNKDYLFKNNYLIMIDVGQGDSILIHYDNKNILIDTGGKVSYKEEWEKESKSISEKSLIPLFKSFGIRKLDYLILSHGDFDHMGEAINLVNNFKVEKVIFNCGEYNDLEKELIKVLDKKKIKYYSCIKELNIDNNKLYFLQTKEYNNENDNSNVIYTELNGYKFMFMGDAGIEKEKDILEKYNLSNIDVLKVGHHGSKTSSGKEFIDEINPKYSIISVGKNNRYGHPNKEVLNNLENSKTYRTDHDGSIMFKIKNNKLQIEMFQLIEKSKLLKICA